MKTQEVATLKPKTVILTILITITALGVWEFYCRTQQYQAGPNDDKGLWAQHRAKVDELSENDVVILGSSRVMFNFQQDVWKDIYGKDPVVLAAAGCTVLPMLEDVVKNSDFAGKLIVGVTPPLYFVPQIMQVPPYRRIKQWVDHYHDRTYADRLNHFISLNGPQQLFSFLTTSNEVFYNELDLRTMIEQLPVPKRSSAPPPFPILYYVDEERNVNLMPQVMSDTVYRNTIINFWSTMLAPPKENAPPPDVIDQNRLNIIEQTADLLDEFKARGGEVILVRCPTQHEVRKVEAQFYPRELYWDQLVKAVNSPAYHFEDHEFMQGYELPEWSHLATTDAKLFTHDFLKQAMADQNL